MAIVYPQATLSPSKRELMEAWLPTRSWYDGSPDRKPVGSFRFDDPEGEVGCEGFLLGGEGLPTYFLPLTYRAAEVEGAQEHLVGTTEHSELGPRWVYDGCADPVFVRELVRAVLTGGTGVDHEFDLGNGLESRPTSAQVRGSGSGSDVSPIDEVGCHDEGPLTIVNAGALEVVVARVVGTYVDAAETLAVTWKGGDEVAIAGVRPG
jgi:Maltokinase N-terminal cap domain